MTTDSATIDGRHYAPDRNDIENALQQFYHAFNNGDLELMRANWLQGGDACMANPLGGVRRGWADIEPVYVRIFHGSARVYVEFHDYRLYPLQDAMVAVGRERGHVERDGRRLELAIRTSRVYRLEAGCWRQLHHHGSIENPALLKAYQELVS